mmetsp:Transcript_13202/g.17955  ORF Transcript_13202/g.17955 Transcript_13202/m.17955 type:complete len:157 (+) Transcript_13202:793-1263(+)
MMLKTGQLEARVHKNIVRNRAEMFAYNMIAMARSVEAIKHACNINWDDFKSDDEKDLVREALRIQQVIKHKNWIEYFRTLRRPTTNYFIACLMLIVIDSMRLSAIENIYISYRMTGMPRTLVRAKLNLPTEEDANTLIEACGFYEDNETKPKVKRV